MSKILFNEEKLKNSIKSGVAMVLAAATVASFSGCTSNNYSDGNESLVSSNIIVDAPDETVEDVVEEVVEELHDWTNAEEVAKTTNEEAKQLLFSSREEGTSFSKNKYAVILCEKENDYKNLYYRLIDNAGNYLDNDYYKAVTQINDHTLLLATQPISERTDADDYLTSTAIYTIFDQITGKTTEIEALSLSGYDGAIIKTNYSITDGVGELTYELLNTDGTTNDKNIYTGFSCDKATGILYLSKNGKTEALDLKTKKRKQLDGTIHEANDGYISLTTESDDEKYDCILYLDDIDNEPQTILSANDATLRVGIYDKDNPIFIKAKFNNDKLGYDVHLLDKDNNVLSNELYSRFDYDYDAKLIKAYKWADVDYKNKWFVDPTYEDLFIDVFNINGEKVVENITNDEVDFIPLSDLAVFYNLNQKLGITNYSNTEVLVEPQFDVINLHPIYKLHEDNSSELVDCYLICRNETNKQTTIYNTDLELIATPDDYGYCDACDLADADYKEKTGAKSLVKTY